jgi:tRNA 2-thiouridine synthesizing protein A
MPMVESNKAIKSLALGDVLEIIATDIGTRSDIPSWCERTGQTLLSMTDTSGVLRYIVRKDR